MIIIVSRTEGDGHGAEVVLNYLLCNYRDKKNIGVITAENSSVHITCMNNQITVYPVIFTAEKYVSNLLIIEKLLKQLKNVHLIHAWQSKSFEISWYMAKRLNVNLTCTLHDHPKSNIYTKRKLWFLKNVAYSAKGVVAVSNALKMACIASGYKNNIDVIPNGLPDLHVQKSKRSKKVIGFLGMYAHLKGFNIVSEWIERMSGLNVHWNLYGDVCDDNLKMVGQLEMKQISNYSLLGHRPSVEIFCEIDILVNTSIQFDSFPTVLLEAARAAIPAVSNTNGGAKEIVDDNVTGFIYDAGDPGEGFYKLKSLVSDQEMVHQFSLNARSRFETNFTVDKMVGGYEMFWQKMGAV